MSEKRGLHGLKVLLVEDEYLLALEMKALLLELGAEVAGPVGRLKAARDLARSARLDGAVLDVKLDGDTSIPLADELTERGVPLIFTTGFDSAALPDRFKNAPCLAKPVDGSALRRLALKHFSK